VFSRDGTNWTQQARLTAADGEYGDRFGCSVCIDSNRLAVGAFGNDQTAPDAGAVYVFTRSAPGWAQEDKLLADDGGTEDRFGAAVSISGPRILVGAYKHWYYTDMTGVAYMFERDGSGWEFLGVITAPHGGYGGWPDQFWPGHFGQAVSVSGRRFAVGARLSAGSTPFSGEVYVYDLE
jgi:hypothetical protein